MTTPAVRASGRPRTLTFNSSVFKVSKWKWKDGKRWNVRECLFFVPFNQEVAEGTRRYEGGKCGKINHTCAFLHIVRWPRGEKGGRTFQREGRGSAPPFRSTPSPPPLSRGRERGDPPRRVGERPYGGAEAPPFPRHFHGSRSCPSADGHPEIMKMREAPWSAAAELPPCNPNQKAVAGATALQGAFGTTIFKAAKGLRSCFRR
jgi:hypothetical protein